MVVISGQTSTLNHMPRVSFTDYVDDQQHYKCRYNCAKHRLKKPPDIFWKILHISRLIAWIPSRLACYPALQWRDQSLLITSLPEAFTVTNNQDGTTVFDFYMCYMLWYSGCTHFVNPYFELYIYYKPLEKGDDTEVNGIGGTIKTKGIGTVVLGL